jgi:hypothetical protein
LRLWKGVSLTLGITTVAVLVTVIIR